jgi:hypothetical protein
VEELDEVEFFDQSVGNLHENPGHSVRRDDGHGSVPFIVTN